VIFGDPALGVPSADDWARAAGTINYEIVTRIGPRVARRYVAGLAVDDSRIVDGPEQMEQLGREIGRTLKAGDLVVLTGPLGAGKTTLTRGIGESLGVRGPVTSPTFVLARTHPSLVAGPPLVHVDAYRLADATELDDLDIDFARSVVVVEWGSGFLEGVSESWLDVRIERPEGAGDLTETVAVLDDIVEPRTVTVSRHGSRWLAG
jgi:tRNA threonylcarbamoyl adenosine modification protein YjeE